MKQIFSADTFAANTFACGVWRGVGVDTVPSYPGGGTFGETGVGGGSLTTSGLGGALTTNGLGGALVLKEEDN